MLILISGASASGKSTISMGLSKVISAIIIPQDAYYTCEFMLFPYDKVSDGHLEQPDIIDWKKLIDTVNSIPENVNIIVEGHCLYTCNELVNMADHCFFIDIDYSTCKKRYVSRYSDNYTTNQLEMKEKYFDEFTWPIHKQYMDKIVLKNKNIHCIKCNLESIDNMKNIILDDF